MSFGRSSTGGSSSTARGVLPGCIGLAGIAAAVLLMAAGKAPRPKSALAEAGWAAAVARRYAPYEVLG